LTPDWAAAYLEIVTLLATKEGNSVSYDKPEIVDYGTIEELTAALGPGGQDDGGTKRFHSTRPLDQ
jgi:hypothetical protein